MFKSESTQIWNQTIEVLKGKKQQRCCSAVAFFFLMKTIDIIEGECSSQLRPKINIFKDKYLATYSVKICIQGFIFFLWVSSLISMPSILLFRFYGHKKGQFVLIYRCSFTLTHDCFLI